MSAGGDVARPLEADAPDVFLVGASLVGVQARAVRTPHDLLDRRGSTVEELAEAVEPVRDRFEAFDSAK